MNNHLPRGANVAASGTGAANYSKVPGANTRQAANMMVGGGANRTKPPATNGRSVGRSAGLNQGVAKRAGSRSGNMNDDEDQHMSSASQNQRSGSAARRQNAAAAAYNVGNLGPNKSSGLAAANRGKVNSTRPAQESVFEFTDNLME